MSSSYVSQVFSKCFSNDVRGTDTSAKSAAPRSSVGRRRRLAAVAVVAAVALCVSGCGGADVSGTWEGELVGEDDEVLPLTLELQQEGAEISGEGVVGDDSGEGGPLEVTGGEVEGSQVTIEFEDAFGGQSVQGELNGDLSGDTISGEGRAYSANATGPIDDALTFELQRAEG